MGRFGAAMVLGLVALSGCKAGAGEPCREDRACEEGLVCAEGRCASATASASAAPSESDPATHVARLSDPSRRAEAIDALLRMAEGTVAQDHGDPTGPHAKPLLDAIVAPLAHVAADGKLGPKRQAALLTMLSKSRHPAAAPALVAAIRRRSADEAKWADDRPPSPSDAAMGEVVTAAADLELDEARAPLWTLFTSLRASSRKGEAGAFAAALGRAVERLAVPKWEPEASTLLAGPLDPDGDLRAFRDQLQWQRTAARVLGRLRKASAVEPLMRVALDPQKHDVAPAAIEALSNIGAPAADVARQVLSGEHQALLSHAADRYRNAREKDVADVVDRTADDVRITQATLVIVAVGRADGTEAALDGLRRADPIGRGRIAAELDALPSSEASLEAFRETVEDSPLDLPIADEHRGVVALYLAMPSWLDPSLAPWLSELATKLQGTDTGLAPFREAALRASMLVMTAAHVDRVRTLAELITKSKWEADFDAATALLETCKEDVPCYLKQLAEREKANATEGAAKDDLVAAKAAAMAAIHAQSADADALTEALIDARTATARRLLAAGLAKLFPNGDAARADRLDRALGVAGARDPEIAGVIARLRGRG
ncbi:MAG TPA: hypothetical protein ENK57_06055 [Polyangiaceae bacterium]|nr:hypothetical protein [Polyangiaceae bacterium]